VSGELETALRDWEGEGVVTSFDRPTGAWIFIALHSSALGRPVGGTRLRSYPTPADGLRDAQRLAETMTAKWAILELPRGGAKAVLAVPPELAAAARDGLLRRYGALVEGLRGAFATGEDLGTTPADMAIVAQHTRFVHGVEADRVTDPGPFTARGVYRGIEAAAREVLGRAELRGLAVLVQGVGDVGLPLARELAAGGARLLLSDVDGTRLARAVAELGAEAVAPERALETPCDVLAPCAVSGVVSAATAPRLACRVVAGSANAQLETPADAERLHRRGIVYVPDYVINAGGALAFTLHGEGERDAAVLLAHMDRIGTIVAAILREAAASREPPLHAAARRVAQRLALGRGDAR
jgi:leucine dehydrogenase